MSTSTAKFTEQLKQKTATQQAQIEQAFETNLHAFRTNLNSLFSAAEQDTEKNMAQLRTRLQRYHFRLWLYPLLVLGLLVPLVFALGQALERRIAQKLTTLEALGPAGVSHIIKDGELYLMLPEHASKPQVYQNTTGHWVVKIGE